MASESLHFAVAGGITLVTSMIALRAGLAGTTIQRATHTPVETRVPETTPSAQAATPARSGPTSTRPRILTGEPTAPEQRKPVPHRALKLVAGITALALAGAVGIIAFVRALISMFDAIGG